MKFHIYHGLEEYSSQKVTLRIRLVTNIHFVVLNIQYCKCTERERERERDESLKSGVPNKSI